MNPEQTNRPMPLGRPITQEARSILAFCVWWAWMFCFGRGTDYLDDKPTWDLLGRLYSLGWIGIVIGVALGYGIATALAFMAYHWSGRLWIADRAPSAQAAVN